MLLNSFPYEIFAGLLEVVSPSDFRKSIQPESGHIQRVVAELGRLVIPGEDMVTVKVTSLKTV